MQDQIQATVILNPFHPRAHENRKVKLLEYKEQKIRDVFCDFYPIPSPDVEIVCSINGKVIERPDWDMQLQSGDNLVFVPVPRGGDGGSNPVMLIAMVAIAALAWYAGPALVAAMGYGVNSAIAGTVLFTAGAEFAAGLVSAAIMIGGGLLLNSIMPQPKIDTDFDSQSQTYGWSSFGNSTTEGTGLPVIIGERRVTPPIISCHSESQDDKSYLYLLYAVSEGEIEDVYGLEINDQPIAYYESVYFEKRLGTDSQELIPYFNDTYADKSINVTVKKDTIIIRETSGTGIDFAQVHIAFPTGIYHANDEGGFEEAEVTIAIKWRASGSGSWNSYTPTKTSSGVGAVAYESGTIYEPGQLVFVGETIYRCKAYKMEGERKSGDEWIEGVVWYSESVTGRDMLGGRKRGSPVSTPAPPDENCWEDFTLEEASLAITGSSTTAIQKTFPIEFPSRGQYEISVQIVDSPPDDDPKYGCKMIWAGISEGIKDDLTYPGVALMALKLLATEQISGGIPTVTCVAKKNSHSFTSIGSKPLTNPAWAAYYLLTNDVWGAGIDPEKIYIDDFEEWAAFCDEEEITMCLYLDTRSTFNDIKNYICEIGRANIVQRGTKFYVVIDRPSIPSQLFTVGNIIKDSFKMTYLSQEDRANCIRVSYFDKEMNWEKTIVEIRDRTFNASNKEKAQDITLYACDKQEVAVRHAILLMNYNKHLIRTVEFQVSIDALACTIGDIVRVQHDCVKYGAGGRILSSSGGRLKLDRKIALSSGQQYGILIRNSANDEVKEGTFTVSSSGETDEINCSLSAQKFDVFSLGPKTIEAKPFKIIAITRSGEFTRRITALEYYDEIYNDEFIIETVGSYYWDPNALSLTLEELPGRDKNGYSSLVATWAGTAKSYNVYYKIGTGQQKLHGKVEGNSVTINSLPVNQEIFVTVSSTNNASVKQTESITLTGEVSAIYDNGVYAYGVFVTPKQQEAIGSTKVPNTMWLQEPNEVRLEFTDLDSEVDGVNPGGLTTGGSTTGGSTTGGSTTGGSTSGGTTLPIFQFPWNNNDDDDEEYYPWEDEDDRQEGKGGQ